MNLKSETMSNDGTHISDTVEKHFFRASAADFKKIPGSPIAYWGSSSWLDCFSSEKMDHYLASEGAVKTGNNERYVRFIWEVSANTIGIDSTWRKHPKGGDFRKWYGNVECIVNWSESARKHYREDHIARIPVENVWNIKGITWTAVSSSSLSFRLEMEDEIANNAALFIYPKNQDYLIPFLCCLNACQTSSFLKAISPTLNFLVGDILSVPYPNHSFSHNDVEVIGEKIIKKSKHDWDSYETSWDFTNLPILNSQTEGRVSDSVTRQLDDVGLRDKATNPTYPLQLSIKETYAQLRAHWQAMTVETQRLEQENNRIFIDAYGLQDELTADVPLNEITLTCNPHYRYGNNKTDAELDALLLADTLKEFISYAVGCMFGRYALDKPGLILANQGETLADYLKQIPEPIFSVDDDNVIPMLDGDWFTDDVTERFGKFLKVTFGEAHYEENLKYIEQALGKDIRKYFLKDFYNDHLKRYKKRPIYWLFSSPKGTFNALIYLHRYRSDTVSVVLNDYLREFRAKLSAHKVHLEAVSISGSASASEKTKALKDIENHRKMLDELDTYEREVLYPLATEQLEIDLDDGVKVNYQKFGEALKKIPGLAAKED